MAEFNSAEKLNLEYHGCGSGRGGIGQYRLREIMREDYECRYHLTIGRVTKIKRQLFEEFLNKSGDNSLDLKMSI